MSDISLDEYFKNDDNRSKKVDKKEKVKKQKTPKNKFKRDNKPTKKYEKKVEVVVSEDFLNNDEGPNGEGTKTVVRLIIWIVIVLIIVRGVMVSINPPRPVIKTEKYIQSLSETEVVKGFAHQFVREYLTYNFMDQSEYKNRVLKYTGDGITIGSRQGWSEVIDSNVWSVKKINEQNAVVIIYVKVKQGQPIIQTQNNTELGEAPDSNLQTNASNTAASEAISEFYVKVPICIVDENKLFVADYPTFITEFERDTSYKRQSFGNLKSSSDNTRKEVNETLENFFMIYDDGTEEQISYYILDSKKVIGYKGQYEFQRIKSLQVLNLQENEKKVLAVAEIIVADSFGTSFEQKFNLLMQKESSQNEKGELITRWYIERFVEQGEKFDN